MSVVWRLKHLCLFSTFVLIDDSQSLAAVFSSSHLTWRTCSYGRVGAAWALNNGTWRPLLDFLFLLEWH